MASIKGYQLKAFKTFRGHEQEPLRQGNLYLGTKKIGFISEDSWGGPLRIDIERSYQGEWEKTADAYLAEQTDVRFYSAEEYLAYQLLDLTADEIQFKKAVKKGYKVLSIIKVTALNVVDGVELAEETGEQHIIQTSSEKDAETYAKKQVKKPFKLICYQKLEDFIIA